MKQARVKRRPRYMDRHIDVLEANIPLGIRYVDQRLGVQVKATGAGKERRCAEANKGSIYAGVDLRGQVRQILKCPMRISGHRDDLKRPRVPTLLLAFETVYHPLK